MAKLEDVMLIFVALVLRNGVKASEIRLKIVQFDLEYDVKRGHCFTVTNVEILRFHITGFSVNL